MLCKKISQVFLALSLGIVLLPTHAQQSAAQELPPRIKVGLLTALTGGAASSGATARPTMELAVKEMNAAGGMAGRPLELVIGDTATDPTQTNSEARRLIQQEKVNIVMGPEIGPFAMAAAPVLTDAKILSFPMTGANTITPQSYPYGFATFYSADSFVIAMVDYAVDVMKAKRIAVMTDSGAQGKSTVGTFNTYIPKRQAILTGMQEYEARSADFTPQLLSLRRGDPDVIIMVSPLDDPGTAFKNTEELNWQVPIINQSTAFTVLPTLQKGGPEVFKSGRIHSLGIKSATYCPGDALEGSDYAKMLARAKAAYPDAFPKMNHAVMPWMFDALALTKAAVEATKSVEAPVLAKWIEENGRSFKAMTGPLAISPTYHLLYGSEIFAFVLHPDEAREDGLVRRVGC